MKTLKFTALFIGLISIFSCTRTEKNIQPFLKGKVYISSNGVEDNCNIIQEGTAAIDKLIKNIDVQIEKLQELRKIKIYEAVTGKIKVV